MEKKTILITGATSGIGKAAAKALAKEGHRIIVHGRNEAKAQAVREEIIAETGNDDIDVVIADLLLMSNVKRMAAEIKERYDRLDVLINNAGTMMNKEREVTQEGLEKTIALNLLAPFLLIESLLDTLSKSPDARIINVSSIMHKFSGKPHFDDFLLENDYSSGKAYGLSKLYLIWVSRRWAAELKQKGFEHMTVNIAHPFISNTNFGRGSKKGLFIDTIFRIGIPLSLSPEKGAESIIYLASSDEVKGVTGQFYGTKKKLDKVKEKYHSAENEQKVWDFCKEITKPYLDDPAE